MSLDGLYVILEFPAWIAGILISGAVAAMMSTADSQLLIATSTLVEDFWCRASMTRSRCGWGVGWGRGRGRAGLIEGRTRLVSESRGSSLASMTVLTNLIQSTAITKRNDRKANVGPVDMSNNKPASQPAPDGAPSTATRRSHPFWKWFWLVFLVLSLGYAGYSFYVPANDVAWADDVVAARQLAAASGKPMLLFFTAEWCVPCRIMKREVFADPDVAAAINANVVPVMVYSGEPGADEVIDRYDVRGTPITIFTDSQGNVLDYGVGKMGKAEFMDMLAKLGAS